MVPYNPIGRILYFWDSIYLAVSSNFINYFRKDVWQGPTYASVKI